MPEVKNFELPLAFGNYEPYVSNVCQNDQRGALISVLECSVLWETCRSFSLKCQTFLLFWSLFFEEKMTAKCPMDMKFKN